MDDLSRDLYPRHGNDGESDSMRPMLPASATDPIDALIADARRARDLRNWATAERHLARQRADRPGRPRRFRTAYGWAGGGRR